MKPESPVGYDWFECSESPRNAIQATSDFPREPQIIQEPCPTHLIPRGDQNPEEAPATATAAATATATATATVTALEVVQGGTRNPEIAAQADAGPARDQSASL